MEFFWNVDDICIYDCVKWILELLSVLFLFFFIKDFIVVIIVKIFLCIFEREGIGSDYFMEEWLFWLIFCFYGCFILLYIMLKCILCVMLYGWNLICFY